MSRRGRGRSRGSTGASDSTGTFSPSAASTPFPGNPRRRPLHSRSNWSDDDDDTTPPSSYQASTSVAATSFTATTATTATRRDSVASGRTGRPTSPRRGAARRKKTPKKKDQLRNALREIKRYQKTTNLLIPMAPFCRVVKEITDQFASNYRWKRVALDALQEAAETFLVQHFEICNYLTIHAKRITLMRSDMILAGTLCAIFNPRLY